MAILHIQGSKLATHPPFTSISKVFTLLLMSMFLICVHLDAYAYICDWLWLESTSWIVVSILLAVVGWQLACRQVIVHSQLSYLLLIVGICCTLPLFFPQSQTLMSLPRLLAMWGGIALYLGMQQIEFSQQQQRQMLLSMLLCGLLMIVSVFLILIFWHSGLGQRLQSAPDSSLYYIQGLGSFVITAFVIADGQLLRRSLKRTDKRALRQKVQFILLVASGTSVIFLLDSLWLWLLTLSTVLLLLFESQVQDELVRLLFWGGSIFAGLLLGIALLFIFPAATHWLSVQLAPLDIHIWQTAIQLMLEHFSFGVGYGQFELHYVLKLAQLHAHSSAIPSPLGDLWFMPNELLHWIIEGGVLVLFAMCLVVAVCFRLTYLLICQQKWSKLALLIPLTGQMFFDSPLQMSVVHWVGLLFVFFTLDHSELAQTMFTVRTTSTPLLKAMSLLLPVAVGLYIYIVMPRINWQTSLNFNLAQASKQVTVKALHSQQQAAHASAPHKKGKRPVKEDNRAADEIMQVDEMLQQFHDAFSGTIYRQQFKKMMMVADPQVLKAYSQWLVGQIKRTPRPSLYYYLITLHSKEASKELIQIQQEAAYLFPTFFSSPQKN